MYFIIEDLWPQSHSSVFREYYYYRQNRHIYLYMYMCEHTCVPQHVHVLHVCTVCMHTVHDIFVDF
jgi:hypothetical protein